MARKAKWISLAKLERMDRTHEEHGHLYFWENRDGVVYYGDRKLARADLPSFELLADDCDSGIARDHQHIFIAWMLKGALDRDTFEALGDGYFRDKHLVYAMTEASIKPLKGRDVANFKNLSSGYARHASHAYFYGRVLQKCTSPLTLRVRGSKVADAVGFAVDDNYVYFEARPLPSADVKTWRPVASAFSTDKERVYYCGEKLPRVDRETWERINDAYSRDKNKVYLMEMPLEDASPQNWELLSDFYSTDKERVYYCGKLVPDAHAATFRVSKKGDASDRNGSFDGAKRVKGRAKK